MYLFLQQGDVCNSRLVNHIFSTENIDVIFHLAAKTHVGEAPLVHWAGFTAPFIHRAHFSQVKSVDL